MATLYNEYSRREVERRVDQVVVEHGTLPLVEVYDALQGRAANRGITDYEALLSGRPQPWQPPKLAAALEADMAAPDAPDGEETSESADSPEDVESSTREGEPLRREG